MQGSKEWRYKKRAAMVGFLGLLSVGTPSFSGQFHFYCQLFVLLQTGFTSKSGILIILTNPVSDHSVVAWAGGSTLPEGGQGQPKVRNGRT